MQQVFSNLKLINWNTNKTKALSISENNTSIVGNNTVNVDLNDENIQTDFDNYFCSQNH